MNALPPLTSESCAEPSGALERLLSARWLPWFLMALAVALRLGRYLHNPAIWLDEGMLVANILDRDVAGLLQPLEYRQGGSILFLLALKACVALFGNSEYALRLAPLCAGVVSVPLFYMAARRTLAPAATSVALAVFAVSEPLIRYSSEVKPYSLDLVLSLGLLLIAMWVCDTRRGWLAWIVWALAGAVAVWASFAAPLALAGLGTPLIVAAAWRRDWRRLAWLSGVVCVWLISFAGCYVLTLRGVTTDNVVQGWWYGHHMPFPPMSPSDVKWFIEHGLAMFAHPVGLTLTGLGAVLFLAGAADGVRRARLMIAVLLGPVMVTLAVSATELYPFTERFLLFVAPMVILLLAHGAERMTAVRIPQSARALVLALLLLQPALESMDDLLLPDTNQGVRPAMAKLASDYQDGDRIYVYAWAHPSFRYYVAKEGLEFADVTVGVSSRRDWSYYLGEIEGLRGNGRVWFMFVPVAEFLGGKEEQFFLTHLDGTGSQVDALRTKWCSLYLYDLRDSAEDR
ncbi:MAG: hypothetical protein GY851_14045 [bacterium]|nr:hypothetical protein [bacterium]